eukprot:1917090-Rhodomonas_salina.2
MDQGKYACLGWSWPASDVAASDIIVSCQAQVRIDAGGSGLSSAPRPTFVSSESANCKHMTPSGHCHTHTLHPRPAATPGALRRSIEPGRAGTGGARGAGEGAGRVQSEPPSRARRHP